MSIEQQIDASCRWEPFNAYAERTLLDELIRRQNSKLGFYQPIFLNASLQKLCAESLLRELGEKPYFQKFGGKVLSLVMVPTGEPYMYNVGLVVNTLGEQ